jgi:hypothetical protein
MTAAQKAAKEKFKKAIAYRKKTGCTLKQAFAHVYGKKAVGAVKKKAAPKKKAATKKKAAVKKKAAPKKKAVSYHKDTKSHNVKISVVSGIKEIDNKILDELNWLLNEIGKTEIIRDRFQSGIKYKKYDKENIIIARKNVKKANDYIKSLKQNFRNIKKNLK